MAMRVGVLVPLVAVALSVSHAYVFQGVNEFCNYLPEGFEIKKTDSCESLTCLGSGGLYAGEGCGVGDLAMSSEQIKAGCEVKQVELSPSTLYPECCEKYLSCPVSSRVLGSGPVPVSTQN